MTNCRLRWRTCGHSCPRVGTAGPMHRQTDGCSLDLAEQVGAQSWEVAVVCFYWGLRGLVAVGICLPLLHRLPSGPGTAVAGGWAAWLTRTWPGLQMSQALWTSTCGRRSYNLRP